MLSVRIRDKKYRISNETLDRLFGEAWRHSEVGLLQKRIQQHHEAGELVTRRGRLEVATTVELAEQHLRSADGQEEILRWGLLYVASQITEATNELRALRDALAFDEAATTARLSRDSTCASEHDLG
jgi:hypothetical protein